MILATSLHPSETEPLTPYAPLTKCLSQYLAGLVRHLLQVVARAGGAGNMNKAANAVRTVDLSKFDVVVKDAEDNAAAAVRAGGFNAAAWRQVALDLVRHAKEIDTGRLSEIIELVLQLPPPSSPERKKLQKVSQHTHTHTHTYTLRHICIYYGGHVCIHYVRIIRNTGNLGRLQGR